MERDFKGVWIPRDIWLDNNLGWSEKLLLVEIDSLSILEKGCFATNDYFAKFFGLSKDRISKIVSNLKNKNYIEVKLIYNGETKSIDKRVITTLGYRRKQLEGIGENNYRGIGENNEDNNTSFNNTINKDSQSSNNNEIKKNVAKFIQLLQNQNIMFSGNECNKIIGICEELQLNPMSSYNLSSYLRGETSLQLTKRMFLSINTYEKMKLGDYNDKQTNIKKEVKHIVRELTESQKQILKRNEIKDGIYDGRFD